MQNKKDKNDDWQMSLSLVLLQVLDQISFTFSAT